MSEIKIIGMTAVFMAAAIAFFFVVSPYIGRFENAGSIQARHNAR